MKITSTNISSFFLETDCWHALLKVCSSLQEYDPKFSWVGFYFMDHQNRMLHLGPYVGKPTDHHHIPFGRGICGQVAVSGDTYLAQDVMAEENYIACSIDVKSEIVIPVYGLDKSKAVAQLDIDSDVAHAFTENDRRMLEDICEKIGEVAGAELEYEKFKLFIDRYGSHQPD